MIVIWHETIPYNRNQSVFPFNLIDISHRITSTLFIVEANSVGGVHGVEQSRKTSIVGMIIKNVTLIYAAIVYVIELLGRESD